jgi:hypothetical protein
MKRFLEERGVVCVFVDCEGGHGEGLLARMEGVRVPLYT